jgi:hypothetical protein
MDRSVLMPQWMLYEGDCVEVMKRLPDNSVDSVVTDPPYELGFMGKKWDSTGIAYSVEMWREVLRVLKPGGHLLSFGGTRTYHRMACAIEDAGFEIRDQLQWLYGSGFPKSLDIGKAIDKAAGKKWPSLCAAKGAGGNPKGYKTGSGGAFKAEYSITVPATPEAVQWNGWGTALKPANEPVCLARKPLAETTIAANVLKWGTGGLNIDGCRIGLNGEKPPTGSGKPCPNGNADIMSRALGNNGNTTPEQGRFPANLLFDEEAAAMLDEQSGRLASGKAPATGFVRHSDKHRNTYGRFEGQRAEPTTLYGDSGGASRFFYVAKASKSERGKGNLHPTVKPVKLMRYLVRLITPPGGTVLDPFAGSGTTLLAAEREGFDSIGIEMNPEYCEIIRKRMAHLSRR